VRGSNKFQFDMEFWYILDHIEKIICENSLTNEKGCRDFVLRFKEIDNRFLEITIPVNNAPKLTVVVL
jgi:hypothetical protein